MWKFKTNVGWWKTRKLKVKWEVGWVGGGYRTTYYRFETAFGWQGLPLKSDWPGFIGLFIKRLLVILTKPVELV